MVVLWDISTGKIGPAQVLREFQLLERGGERVLCRWQKKLIGCVGLF